MTEHSVQITPATPVGLSRVLIDGQDITTAVQSLTLDLDARDVLPEVRLTLGHVEFRTIEMERAQVVLAEPSREALIALGWTPPPEEQ